MRKTIEISMYTETILVTGEFTKGEKATSTTAPTADDFEIEEIKIKKENGEELDYNLFNFVFSLDSYAIVGEILPSIEQKCIEIINEKY